MVKTGRSTHSRWYVSGLFALVLLITFSAMLYYQRAVSNARLAEAAQSDLRQWAQTFAVKLISASSDDPEAPAEILSEISQYQPELSILLQDGRGELVLVQGPLREVFSGSDNVSFANRFLIDASTESQLMIPVSEDPVTDTHDVYQLPIQISGSSYKLTLAKPAAGHSILFWKLFVVSGMIASLCGVILYFVMPPGKAVPQMPVQPLRADPIADSRNDFSRTLSTSQTDLIANVSHDLRTPLTSIFGYSETLLLKDESIDPEKRRRLLGIIRDNTQVLITLVNEVFDLSRLDAGLTIPEMGPIRVEQLFDQVRNTFEPYAEGKGVELKSDAGNVGFVEGDSSLLFRAVSNLVQNAISYTPEGGEVSFEASLEGDSVRFSIIDTGIGIPEEKLNFIFERFYRVNQDRARKTGGAGLGLAISQRIVEAHGSLIEVSSSVGEGTTMSFLLSSANEVVEGAS